MATLEERVEALENTVAALQSSHELGSIHQEGMSTFESVKSFGSPSSSMQWSRTSGKY